MVLSLRDSTLADEQAMAIDYYQARPFGDDGGRAALDRDARRSRGGRIRQHASRPSRTAESEDIPIISCYDQ
jgi:hypothetical protein